MPGQIVFAAMMPADPSVLCGGQADGVDVTLAAIRDLSRRLSDARPDRLIFLVPGGDLGTEMLAICAHPFLSGDLVPWRLPNVTARVTTDLAMINVIANSFYEADMPLRVIDRYGVLPLHPAIVTALPLFQAAGLPDLPVSILVVGSHPAPMSPQFGQLLAYAAQHGGRRVALIGCGDFAVDAQTGIAEAFQHGDWPGLHQVLTTCPPFDPAATVLAMVAGAVERWPCHAHLLSFAATARSHWLVGAIDVPPLVHPVAVRPAPPASTLAELAKEAIYHYLTKGVVIQANDTLLERFGHRHAGVFVTVYRHGKSIVSKGSVTPCQDNLCEEVIRNAVAAAVSDIETGPLVAHELANLSLSVSVCGPLEVVTGLDQVDPARFALVVSIGLCIGVVLPGTDGITSPQEQIALARYKVALMNGSFAWTYRCTVEQSNSWDALPSDPTAAQTIGHWAQQED